jgi:hypothetical protein
LPIRFRGPRCSIREREVDISLYSVDFTRDPSVSYLLLHLEDTVTTGRKCLACASVKAVEFGNETLRVLVEYGREQLPGEQKAQMVFKERAMRSNGSPLGFPKQPFILEFRMGSTGFANCGPFKERLYMRDGEVGQRRWTSLCDKRRSGRPVAGRLSAVSVV